MAIEGVCYVDFTGDLRTAICSAPVTAEDLEQGRRVTLYMSSATCAKCRAAIQDRIAQLASVPAFDVSDVTPPTGSARARRAAPSSSPPA